MQFPKPRIVDVVVEPLDIRCGICHTMGKLYDLGTTRVFYCPKCHSKQVGEFCELYHRNRWRTEGHGKHL